MYFFFKFCLVLSSIVLTYGSVTDSRAHMMLCLIHFLWCVVQIIACSSMSIKYIYNGSVVQNNGPSPLNETGSIRNEPLEGLCIF